MDVEIIKAASLPPLPFVWRFVLTQLVFSYLIFDQIPSTKQLQNIKHKNRKDQKEVLLHPHKKKVHFYCA